MKNPENVVFSGFVCFVLRAFWRDPIRVSVDQRSVRSSLIAASILSGVL